MSKWSLLRNALTHSKGGEEEKEKTAATTASSSSSSSVSIHRFEGHQRLKKQKTLWTGFHLTLHLSSFSSSLTQLLSLCEDYFHRIDTAEFLLQVESRDKDALQAFLTQLLTSSSPSPPSLPLLQESSHNNMSFSIKKDIESTPTSDELHEVLLRVTHLQYVPIQKTVEYHKYDLTFRGEKKEIWTREPPKKKKLNIQELLSDRLYGVDNTGNICVWPSEPLLLHLLLSEANMTSLVEGKSVLEVGGGMTGLIGLGLASFNICKRICITDGHPHCVVNQKSCVEMNRVKQSIMNNGDCCVDLLEWSQFLNHDINSADKSQWEVIIGSDCLFFKDYHDALIKLLDTLLTQDGIAVFFQPSRSRTMDMFLQKASELFQWELVENYLSEVYEESLRLRRDDSSYDVDIHYPLMLLIKRKNN